MGDEKFRVEIAVDKPTSGMWHCGPNPSWVTVTHLPTMTQARAYGMSQHKARAAAMACVQMMLDDSLSSDDVCSFPEALGDTAAIRAAALREAAEEVLSMNWDDDPLELRLNILALIDKEPGKIGDDTAALRAEVERLREALELARAFIARGGQDKRGPVLRQIDAALKQAPE